MKSKSIFRRSNGRGLTQAEITKDRQLGSTVREIRQQAQITQKDLANLMGCSTGFLADLERGNRHWSAKWKQAFDRVIG